MSWKFGFPLTTEIVLIEFHEKLDQLKVEMHLLQTENKMLRGKNIMQSNKIKMLKVIQSSKTEEKEPNIKELQNKLCQANKIAAEKIKQLNKLKQDIVPEEEDIMLSWGRKNPSLRNKNDAVSTQNEWNRKTDSLASDLEAFKKFVTEEQFSLKTCVKTVKQLNWSIDQPISWQYSETSKPVPYQKNIDAQQNI